MYQRLVFIFCIFTSGCISMPDTKNIIQNMYNIPTFGVSKFDGTQHVRMSNMFCSSTIILEMYQDTNKALNDLVLVKAGVSSINNIGGARSLLFKVDGDIKYFTPTSELTEHSNIYLGSGVNKSYSFKTYLIPEVYIRKMANANELMAKMYLLNNTYVEGDCSITDFDTYSKNNPNSAIKITQEHINMSNLSVAQTGIKNFMTLIDNRVW
ncbi:MAG: hypothetical protein AXW17_05290 [Colwellia sp. Phe_37]|nr:MAG: hypothetical protein AXW17_05290 [Colwellia sp. Phe_37]